MAEFFKAALPWGTLAVAVAVAFSILSIIDVRKLKNNRNSKGDSEND